MNGNFAPSIWSHKHSCDSGHVSRRRQEGPSIDSPVFCFPRLERECPPCSPIRTSTQKNNMHTDKHVKGQANIQTYKNTGLVLVLLCFAFPGLESALSVNNRARPLRTHTDNAPNRPTMPILYIIQRKTFPDKDCRERVDTAQQGSTIQMGDNRRFFSCCLLYNTQLPIWVACFTTQLQILPVNFRYLGNCGILSEGKGSYVWTSQLCCLEEGALSNTTVAILQSLSEPAVFCISRIANFRLFPAAGVEE